MDTWPGTFIYQPSQQQAPCACNENYYQLMTSCLTCQSSSSAKLSVKPLDAYKLVCQAFGVNEWTPIYIPNKPTTTTAPPKETATPDSDNSSSGSKHGLASGAIAG
ncbi:hypothetical protein BGZ76_003321, partial [Entomortierella beljakovae]